MVIGVKILSRVDRPSVEQQIKNEKNSTSLSVLNVLEYPASRRPHPVPQWITFIWYKFELGQENTLLKALCSLATSDQPEHLHFMSRAIFIDHKLTELRMSESEKVSLNYPPYPLLSGALAYDAKCKCLTVVCHYDK